MILGNSMMSAALAGDRLQSDLRSRSLQTNRDRGVQKRERAEVSRLSKKAHLLRCARSPRSNVSVNTPPLVDFLARLASGPL
jgi:ABC-type iron transport system FetAB permease component